MFRVLSGVAALGAVALATLCPWAAGGDVLQVGQPAPPFSISTLDGQSVSGNFHGRPAYINVFATWCSPCRRELPGILGVVRQYRDRVAVLFVDEQDSPDSVKRFAAAYGVATPVAIDRGQFAATFAVGGLPWSIFIDKNGVVAYVYRGLISRDALGDELSKLTSS